MKNYWFKSVFSRCKKNLPLKLSMTVICKKLYIYIYIFKIIFYKQIETFIFSLYLNPPKTGNS